MPRDLDLSPLGRPVGLGTRVRAVGGDARLVIGGTIAVLMVVIPVVVLTVLVVVGSANDVAGIAGMVLLLGAGLYTLYDVLFQAGAGSALTAFARANDLVPVRASMATHYAASAFASGRYAVQQGVRTREPLFVEVGDRGAVTARRAADGDVRPEVYLRVRLPGTVEGRRGMIPPDLHEALTRFAGPHVVDVQGDELTLLGSRPLEPRSPERVAEAFALADALAERARDRCTPVLSKAEPEPTPARGRSPWVVVAGTLALLVVGPLLIAVVMSSLEDDLRGDAPAARLVVGLLVVVVLLVVGWLVRLALSPRRRR